MVFQPQLSTIQDDGLTVNHQKKFSNKATRAPDQYSNRTANPTHLRTVGGAKCNACPSTVSPCYTYDFDVLASFACQVYS